MAKRAAELLAEIKDLRTKYEDIISKNDPTHEPELMEMDVKISDMLGEYSKRAQEEKLAADNRQAMAQLFAPDSRAAQPTGDGAKSEPKNTVPQSYGERFLADARFKAWHDDLTANGTQSVPERVAIKSPIVEIGESLLERKAVVTGLSSTSGGALVVNERTNIIVPAVRDAMRVVDLLTRMTTNSDTVEYVRVTTETNAAVPVLEATSVANGAKPESSVALAVVTAIVENIAHYINITRRALADAG